MYIEEGEKREIIANMCVCVCARASERVCVCMQYSTPTEHLCVEI